MSTLKLFGRSLGVMLAVAASSGCDEDDGAVCVVDGKTYQVGDTFPSTDGCNSCTCDATGQAECTLIGCTGGGGMGGGGSGGGTLAWFTSCGDPVCAVGGAGGDDPGLSNCTSGLVEGNPCTDSGATCELSMPTCGEHLVCAKTDPKAQGCPISQAKHKRDIHYLTPAELDVVREDLLRVKLAEYSYKTEPEGTAPHRGLIIDDQPNHSAAVLPSRERVDVYGLASMAVATLQRQQEELMTLRTELATMRQELKELKARKR